MGKLRYAVPSRIDLLFAVLALSRKLAAPTERDWQSLLRVLRYLQATSEVWLKLSVSANTASANWDVTVYADTDWAGNPETRKSVGCLLGFVNGILVQAESNVLKFSTTSSGESEYHNLCGAGALGLQIREILAEFHGPSDVLLCTDSTTAMAIGSRHGPGKVRHLAVKHLWLQEKVASGQLKLKKVPGPTNIADLGTKALPAAKLVVLAKAAGLCLPTEQLGTVCTVTAASLHSCVLFEYACDAHSLLSRYFEDAGGTAYRLCLPVWNLLLFSIIERVWNMAVIHASYGHQIRVWMSLPCTAWCPWQFINLAADSEQTNARITAERRESIRMLNLAVEFAECLLAKVPNSYFYFEWPLRCQGWDLPIVRRLRSLLPFECTFDGCAYNLRDGHGQLIKKSWRVITNHLEFTRRVHRTCNGRHQHGQVRGATAIQSGYYNRRLVAAFIAAMRTE